MTRVNDRLERMRVLRVAIVEQIATVGPRSVRTFTVKKSVPASGKNFLNVLKRKSCSRLQSAADTVRAIIS